MKILMVCLGNICRSPLAHGVFEHLVMTKNLNWSVDSAGTGNWHIGNPPDRRSIKIAKQHGIDISKQVAQQFEVEFFDQFDHILVMDNQNYKDVIQLARNENDRNKVRLFLESGHVPDPYFDDNQFEPVFELIYKRGLELIEEFSTSK